jgi:hypothetical protein
MARKGGAARKGGPALTASTRLGDLRGLYGERLADIRSSYETEIKRQLQRALDAGADNAKIASLYAKQLRRQHATDYQMMIRQFRSDTAALRRSGLVGKEVKASTARPTQSLLQRIAVYPKVAAGEQRGVKVTRQIAKKLKAQGVEVRKGRAILSPEFKVTRSGQVVQKGGLMVPTRRIYLDDDPSMIEATMEQIFDGMDDDELIMVEAWDNLSHAYLPRRRKEFIAKIMAYQPPRNGLRYITVVKVTDENADSWINAHTEGRLERAAKRRKERAREKRQAKRGGGGGMGAHRYTPQFPKPPSKPRKARKG